VPFIIFFLCIGVDHEFSFYWGWIYIHCYEVGYGDFAHWYDLAYQGGFLMK